MLASKEAKNQTKSRNQNPMMSASGGGIGGTLGTKSIGSYGATLSSGLENPL